MNTAATELSENERLFASCIPPMALETFARYAGRGKTTMYRWIEQGLLSVENIHGHLYVMAEEIMRFNKRVKAGEFARNPLPLPEACRRRAKHHPERKP
jgi:hypothetical protein